MKQLDNILGLDFWKASCSWKRKIEHNLKQLGLTHPQFIVLYYILQFSVSNKNISQINLSKETGIDTATISQIVRGLEKKLLLKRKHLKGDERSKFIKLSELGEKITTESIAIYSSATIEFFEPVVTNFDVFMKDLKKLSI
jgi:DNA-binding MarR family transcriptional regulator